MSKRILFFAVVAVVLSCQKEVNVETGTEGATFMAGIEGSSDTRTCLSDERKVYWEEGDEVAINGVVYSATPVGGDRTWAELSKMSGVEPSAPYSAVYPASIYNAGKLELPAVQKYDPDGISNVPMYAAGTSKRLYFKNVFAVLKINVESGLAVKAVRVSSDLVMNGEFSVENGVAVMVKSEGITSADKEVTLDCGESGATGSVFYVAIPAGDYSGKNLKIGVVYSSGDEYEMPTNQSAGINVPKNTISTIAFRGKYPVYREGSWSGVPIRIGNIWWAPVNCGYDPLGYKFGKLYQFGRIDGCGYAKATNISELTVSGVKRVPSYSCPAEAPIQTVSKSTSLLKNPEPSKFYYNTGDYGDWYAIYYSQVLSCWPHTAAETPENSSGIGSPCPSGWRVARVSDFTSLVGGVSEVVLYVNDGVIGTWFDGTSSPGENKDGVFLPAAGQRYYDYKDIAEERGMYGYYWTSEADRAGSSSSKCLRYYCHNRNGYYSNGIYLAGASSRHHGYSVRCVHD